MTVDTSVTYQFVVGGVPPEGYVSPVPTNLLPPPVSGMEGDDLSLFGTHGTGAVLSFDRSWSVEGSQSLRVTAAAGATNAAGAIFRDSGYTIAAGRRYRLQAAVRRGSGSATVRITAKWRAPDTGAQVGNEILGSSITGIVGNVSNVTLEAVAPAAADGGSLHLIVRWTTTPGQGQFYQVDDTRIFDLGVEPA